jgi:hypothetical protein
MKLRDILCSSEFENNIKSAVAVSYGTKCISDINAVGGGLFEIELCKSVNKLLPPGYVCLTKKATLSGSYKFPDNFLDTIESDAFHGHSASDLFLFNENNEFLDAVSLKTSMVSPSKSSKNPRPKPCLHNDAKGQIHSAIFNRESCGKVGSVFVVTFDTRLAEVECYYFDRTIDDIIHTTPEGYTEGNHQDISFNGKSYGKEHRRQVVKVFSRNSKTRKKQTSFSRGIYIDGQFIKKVLVPMGIFENPHSFTLQTREIELQSIRELTLGRR